MSYVLTQEVLNRFSTLHCSGQTMRLPEGVLMLHMLSQVVSAPILVMYEHWDGQMLVSLMPTHIGLVVALLYIGKRAPLAFWKRNLHHAGNFSQPEQSTLKLAGMTPPDSLSKHLFSVGICVRHLRGHLPAHAGSVSQLSRWRTILQPGLQVEHFVMLHPGMLVGNGTSRQ